jgi:NAD(P)H dehydrogenase (quinone)
MNIARGAAHAGLSSLCQSEREEFGAALHKTVVEKVAAVCTYGADPLNTFLLGDPPRRISKRLVRAMPGHSVTCSYLALYDMNRSTPEGRPAFQSKVGRAFRAW